jgi:hypothetical protein
MKLLYLGKKKKKIKVNLRIIVSLKRKSEENQRLTGELASIDHILFKYRKKV